MASLRSLKIAVIALVAVASPVASAQDPVSPADEIYERMSAAYSSYDIEAIRSIYSPQAYTADLSPGSPPQLETGPTATDLFAKLFARQKAAGNEIEIVFRVTKRVASANRIIDAGLYRVRSTKGNRSASEPQYGYGRFVAAFVKSSSGNWAIESDTNATAVRSDFEDAPGVVIPAAKYQLDESYYGPLTGDYETSGGCRYRVTRSATRLYLHDACAGVWRGLNRRSGRVWEAGNTVIASGVPTSVVTFAPASAGQKSTLSIASDAAGGMKPATATQLPRLASTEDVTFAAPDGITLAGTIHTPVGSGRHPAVVLVHGSGAQDRHGYASLLDLMGRRFLDEGFVVLQFDKRGSGQSEGEWTDASFAKLAGDVLAARNLLTKHPNVEPSRVGLAGSSQAGWISAKAVEQDPSVPFVLLLGAAGTALTVEEQNNQFYNANQMKCMGLPDTKVAKMLKQSELFYAAKKDPLKAQELRDLTTELASDKDLEAWLMPGEAGADRHQWYNAMETDFDPRPVWKAYGGEALFAFGGNDDQTPGQLSAERISQLRNPRIKVMYSPQSQHLGLVAESTCRAGLEHVSRFDASYWGEIDRWIAVQAARDR